MANIEAIRQWLGAGAINLFGLPMSGKDTQGERLAAALSAQLPGIVTQYLWDAVLPYTMSPLWPDVVLLALADYHRLASAASPCALLTEKAVEVVEKACWQGEEISSSRIRRELEQGRMELVNQLLGYAYSVTGEVLHGRKIGRTLGMPTTNIVPSERKLLPPNGVYATRTVIAGELFEGITNIGYKPTVGAEPRKGVETYLFDLDRNLYGEILTVRFYGYERPERKFDSLEELKKRIGQDVEWGRTYFGEAEEG